MSEYDEYGLPVGTLPPKQPKAAEADSIFKTTVVKQENRHDTRGTSTAKAMELSKKFHANNQDSTGEPDWAGMLLNAKDSAEKFRIRSAREAYQAEIKWQAHLAQQTAQEARTKAVLSTPTRNKDFYANLQRNDPRVYWSTECQRQMRSDKATMGLAFHLKNPK